jgi:outer membrane protein OmpA-like peptidoglycan-associated protein
MMCERRAIGSLSPLIGAFALACLPVRSFAADSPQQDASQAVLSEQQIEQALKPPVTRSFTPRGLTRRDTVEPEQSVNLNIPFEYNSSALKPEASAQLKQLESALTSAALGKDRFVVAGHTDAKGSPEYNKRLSLRRAEAVKRFLVANGMAADRLDTVGYGSEQLLTPDLPADPRNRRVEIRDLGPPQ